MFKLFSREDRDLKRQKRKLYFSKLFFYWRELGYPLSGARKKANEYVEWSYKKPESEFT